LLLAFCKFSLSKGPTTTLGRLFKRNFFVLTEFLRVTGITAAKIFTTYRDRILDLPLIDWTYNIDFCIQHVENNVAIIIGCAPMAQQLTTRLRQRSIGDARLTLPMPDWKTQPNGTSLDNGRLSKDLERSLTTNGMHVTAVQPGPMAV